MTSRGKIKVAAILLAVTAAQLQYSTVDAKVTTQSSVDFYDGRTRKVVWDMNDRKPTLSKVEADLMIKEVFPKAKTAWKDKELEPDFKTLDVFSGCFTRPKTQQRLIFYKYYDGGAGGIFGMAIVENGKLLAHYGYFGAVAANVTVISDLDADGRNEIAIEHWSMHQGYRHGGIDLIGFSDKGVKKFGGFEIADDDLNTNKCFKYLLTAKTGKAPAFTTTKYQKIRNKWTKLGKPTPLAPKDDTDYLTL